VLTVDEFDDLRRAISCWPAVVGQNLLARVRAGSRFARAI
jgi:hypothetical protein